MTGMIVMAGLTWMTKITRMREVIRVTEMVRMTGMFYLFGHLARIGRCGHFNWYSLSGHFFCFVCFVFFGNLSVPQLILLNVVILAVFFSVWSLNIILVILAILFGRLIILEFFFQLIFFSFQSFYWFGSIQSFCQFGQFLFRSSWLCNLFLSVDCDCLGHFLIILGLLRVSFGHFSWFRHFGLFSRLVLGNFLVIW